MRRPNATHAKGVGCAAKFLRISSQRVKKKSKVARIPSGRPPALPAGALRALLRARITRLGPGLCSIRTDYNALHQLETFSAVSARISLTRAFLAFATSTVTDGRPLLSTPDTAHRILGTLIFVAAPAALIPLRSERSWLIWAVIGYDAAYTALVVAGGWFRRRLQPFRSRGFSLLFISAVSGYIVRTWVLLGLKFGHTSSWRCWGAPIISGVVFPLLGIPFLFIAFRLHVIFNPGLRPHAQSLDAGADAAEDIFASSNLTTPGLTGHSNAQTFDRARAQPQRHMNTPSTGIGSGGDSIYSPLSYRRVGLGSGGVASQGRSPPIHGTLQIGTPEYKAMYGGTSVPSYPRHSLPTDMDLSVSSGAMGRSLMGDAGRGKELRDVGDPPFHASAPKARLAPPGTSPSGHVAATAASAGGSDAKTPLLPPNRAARGPPHVGSLAASAGATKWLHTGERLRVPDGATPVAEATQPSHLPTREWQLIDADAAEAEAKHIAREPGERVYHRSYGWLREKRVMLWLLCCFAALASMAIVAAHFHLAFVEADPGCNDAGAVSVIASVIFHSLFAVLFAAAAWAVWSVWPEFSIRFELTILAAFSALLAARNAVALGRNVYPSGDLTTIIDLLLPGLVFLISMVVPLYTAIQWAATESGHVMVDRDANASIRSLAGVLTHPVGFEEFTRYVNGVGGSRWLELWVRIELYRDIPEERMEDRISAAEILFAELFPAGDDKREGSPGLPLYVRRRIERELFDMGPDDASDVTQRLSPGLFDPAQECLYRRLERSFFADFQESAEYRTLRQAMAKNRRIQRHLYSVDMYSASGDD